MLSYLNRFEDWYERHERRISSFGLLAGFIFDNLTLKRIDLLYENMVMLSYLLIAGGGITLVNYFQEYPPEKTLWLKVENYLPLFIQFAFGGLFSAFFIFYTRGGSVIASWPFILILIGLIIGNEFFKSYYRRMVFQVSVYFLAVFSFSIFFVPIMLKTIGPHIFLLSGLASLAFMFLFIGALFKVVPKNYSDNKIKLRNSIISIFLVVNVLYFLNLIPPIPLSMKNIGVYHLVERVGVDYRVMEELSSWYERLRIPRTITLQAGSPLYVFGAVFAPTDLNTKIVHDWQYFDRDRKRWVSVTRISFPIIGGRDGGYRSFSRKENLSPGLWRVDVKTERGQVIGRVRFDIELSTVTPALEERVI